MVTFFAILFGVLFGILAGAIALLIFLVAVAKEHDREEEFDLIFKPKEHDDLY